MIQWRRIDHVQVTIPPGEVDAAREFYGEVLGLTPIEQPDSFGDTDTTWYRAGDVEIHLGVEDSDEQSRRHPAFEIADVAAARDRLEAHGIETVDEPPIPGRERFSFRDPFDNRIELLQRA
ncbi:VOC family protein [Halococcus agarilyticus]|uniref:VOC family protein n=1 Tax=Halococcus agarilyticus TaxID=1232219 RepID=UPI000677A782|nr:VOC family protein [Halococcus agarilyticus]